MKSRKSANNGPAGCAATIARLEEEIALLEGVIENLPGGILVTGRDLEIVLCNNHQRRMLDYPETLFVHGNPSLRELFHFNAARGEYGPGRVAGLVRDKMELVRQRAPHAFERTRPNGMVLEIRGAPIEDGGFVTIYLDQTERRRDQNLIAHMAHHDALTGPANRARFMDRLNVALARVGRGNGIALHNIDLDRFKPVNDKLGHEAGDSILVETARRLGRAVRETDTVARLGGDEFIILQDQVQAAAEAGKLAGRIIKAMAEPFVSGGMHHEIGASLGIALSPSDATDAQDLVRRADEAMYRAKTEGGSGFRFHGPARGALAAIS